MRNILFVTILSLLLTSTYPCYAQDQIVSDQMSSEFAPLTNVKVNSGEDLKIDFETYQRNIDDLFQIALMKSPTVEYGLNSVIVNLNRQIADNPTEPEYLISLAHVYRIIGQPSEANRFYEKALALDPERFHLNIFSALTHSQIESYEKALIRLEKATTLQPTDSYAWLVKGRVLMLLNRDDEAIESLMKAFELNPDNRQIGFALSLLYEQTKQHDKAFTTLELLKEKKPDDIFVQYHLGALSLMAGETEQALQYWTELFNNGVRDTQFLFNLSMAYLENSEASKAEKILEHLQFFLPNELDVELLMAEGYRQMDKLEEAERRYRLVLAENPRYVTAYIGLAQVLEEQGRSEESNTIMQEASFYANRAKKKNTAELEMREFRSQIFGDPDFIVPGEGERNGGANA